jgi:hypothetical protein
MKKAADSRSISIKHISSHTADLAGCAFSLETVLICSIIARKNS